MVLGQSFRLRATQRNPGHMTQSFTRNEVERLSAGPKGFGVLLRATIKLDVIFLGFPLFAFVVDLLLLHSCVNTT